MDLAERVLKEFPHEFQGMPNTEILVRAVCTQMHELQKVFEDLNTRRYLDQAEGKQLDGVGDIVVLSRSDAMRLVKKPITHSLMDDAFYRHFLRFKVLKNTSMCNYCDVVTAIQMIWGVDDVDYFENPEEPATMTITFPEPDGPVELEDIPPIKAAGVGIHIWAKNEVRVRQRLYAGALSGVIQTAHVSPAPNRPRRTTRRLFAGSAIMAVSVVRVAARPRKELIQYGE